MTLTHGNLIVNKKILNIFGEEKHNETISDVCINIRCVHQYQMCASNGKSYMQLILKHQIKTDAFSNVLHCI